VIAKLGPFPEMAYSLTLSYFLCDTNTKVCIASLEIEKEIKD